MTEDFDMDETRRDETAGEPTSPAGAGPAAAAARPTTDDAPTIDGLVAQWRAELDGQTSISATNVQDRLLDLWGALPENDVRAEVEKWLTETLARQLYQVQDITARLDDVLASEN